MNNAQRIVAILDRHPTTEIEIIVFGSAAIMLDPLCLAHLKTRQTNDVDTVLK